MFDVAHQNKYNNRLIAKLILMWKREERKEMRAWLPCKHQVGYGSICISRPK
jgi:hypothetical protein